MDGLECSEILKSELEFSGRIDAEYYQKKYLAYQDIINRHDVLPLFKIADFLIGPFGSAYDTSSYVEQSDYRYIRGQDVKPFLLQDTSPRYMADSDFFRLKKYALSSNDILVSVVGTLGNACIIQNHEIPAIFSCKSTAIKSTGINPFYLLCYLNSKYGKSLLLRKERGAIQKGLNLYDIKTLDTPMFSDLFSECIEMCVNRSFDCIRQAKCNYRDATKQIEEIVGQEQELPEINCSTKTISESFSSTGRLDAEFYQEKYRAYETGILSAAQGYTYIKKEFLQIKEKCSRELDAYNYVEIGDIDVGAGTATFNAVNTSELPDNAKIMTKQGDLLVSTVRPNRGAVAILEDEGLLVSGAFTVLRENGNYPKEILQVLLRTSIYRDWLLRFNVGTSYPVIKDEDVLNMPIPLFEETVKQSIVSKVKEAASLRSQSEQLLEYAKQAVEMAIEQREDVALAWLKEKIGEQNDE
ncbi:dNA methylase-type I restriction-modification system [Firmicutes bacterium CAG:114]|nr:dNA methylase-type I restriction-modification system [Firmicutes bacterium CAG:114]